MALSPGWELVFLRGQMPIYSGSRANDIQTNVCLGGKEQGLGRWTVKNELGDIHGHRGFTPSFVPFCERRQRHGETNR